MRTLSHLLIYLLVTWLVGATTPSGPSKAVVIRQTNDGDDVQAIPVFVMLPLNLISNDNKLQDERGLRGSFRAIKLSGATGVMGDVWWGLVESNPKQYDWSAYDALVKIVADADLKMQVVMSFHQCGGNVGDTCDIKLPEWIRTPGDAHGTWYTDREGNITKEYINFAADNMAIFGGRTPIEIYRDFMQNFVEHFRGYLGSTITEIQVGCGPAGELRYPSYPLNRWQFPGIGEFQCYDTNLKESLKIAAEAKGHPEWGTPPGDEVGHYNDQPEDTIFFGSAQEWDSARGQFFMDWYQDQLLQHGDRVLLVARNVFQETGVKLAAKISGIHWLYKHPSHSAELTAGYNNAQGRDGYTKFATMFAKYGIILDFTCMEKRDDLENYYTPTCRCGPEELVKQVANAAHSSGIELAGENAIEQYDTTALDQTLFSARTYHLDGLTFLRLSEGMFSGENWEHFMDFMKDMSGEEESKEKEIQEDLDALHGEVGSVENTVGRIEALSIFIAVLVGGSLLAISVYGCFSAHDMGWRRRQSGGGTELETPLNR